MWTGFCSHKKWVIIELGVDMSRKNLSLLKGTFTVIILATLVFVVLFFFFPNISMKYFGTAFNKEKAIEDSIVSLVYNAEYMSQEEKEAFNSFLSTEKGKSMVKAISSAASQGKEIVEGVTESQEFQDLYSSVKSSLSPESFERLMEETKSSSEALFSKFKK